MATVPSNDNPVTQATWSGFYLSGVHGCISLVERFSNAGGQFNYQSQLELEGAIARLQVLLAASKQGVKLCDVQGVDGRILERAYRDKPDTTNPDRLKDVTNVPRSSV